VSFTRQSTHNSRHVICVIPGVSRVAPTRRPRGRDGHASPQYPTGSGHRRICCPRRGRSGTVADHAAVEATLNLSTRSWQLPNQPVIPGAHRTTWCRWHGTSRRSSSGDDSFRRRADGRRRPCLRMACAGRRESVIGLTAPGFASTMVDASTSLGEASAWIQATDPERRKTPTVRTALPGLRVEPKWLPRPKVSVADTPCSAKALTRGVLVRARSVRTSSPKCCGTRRPRASRLQGGEERSEY
jgi:hypothetical protein